MTDIRQQYFDWLISPLRVPKKDIRTVSEMFDIPYYYRHPMDANRYEDAVALRYLFSYECNIDQRIIASEIDIFEVSVLEVLIALSRRIEAEMSDAVNDNHNVWFKIMFRELFGRSSHSKEEVVDICNDMMSYSVSLFPGVEPCGNLWASANKYLYLANKEELC